MPAIRIKTIVDTFTAKTDDINIRITALPAITYVHISFFFFFFHRFSAALAIRIPTAILIPLNAFATTVISRKLSKNLWGLFLQSYGYRIASKCVQGKKWIGKTPRPLIRNCNG